MIPHNIRLEITKCIAQRLVWLCQLTAFLCCYSVLSLEVLGSQEEILSAKKNSLAGLNQPGREALDKERDDLGAIGGNVRDLNQSMKQKSTSPYTSVFPDVKRDSSATKCPNCSGSGYCGTCPRSVTGNDQARRIAEGDEAERRARTRFAQERADETDDNTSTCETCLNKTNQCVCGCMNAIGKCCTWFGNSISTCLNALCGSDDKTRRGRSPKRY